MTASLQAWADGETNYGWVIAQNHDDANNWYFYSAEGTTPPLLEVTLAVATEEPIAGDANNDGRVDGSDVTILAGNWQYGVTAATTAVPEPSVLTLLGLAATMGLLILRRKLVLLR